MKNFEKLGKLIGKFLIVAITIYILSGIIVHVIDGFIWISTYNMFKLISCSYVINILFKFLNSLYERN